MWSVWPVPTAVLCDQLQYTNILYKIITNLKWDRKFEIQKSNMCRQAQMFYSLFFYLFLFYIHCVWSTRLCKSTWGHCSIYNRRLPAGFSYRRLYLQLDEGCLTFNANPQEVTHAQTSKIFSHIGTHSIPGSAVCVCVCVCACACARACLSSAMMSLQNYVFDDVIILSVWCFSNLSLGHQSVYLCVCLDL